MSDARATSTVSARSFAAGQQFVTGVKIYWHRSLYPALRDEYAHRARADGGPVESVADVRRLLEDSTLYRYFAWCERHMQRLKYSGRYGLVPWFARQRETAEPSLDVAKRAELDPALEMPRYYVNCDIHQHPGGVWSDAVAGLVYERAARTTAPLSGERYADVHDRFTDLVGESGWQPERILDMGCGFGGSTRPFAEQFPEASIDAIDLAAPCLKVAAARDDGRTRYRQMDAARTDYPDAHFDLVTSTMLLHEMPPPVVERTVAEAARVLRPGGRMIHLDFYHFRDPFQRFIHYTHGRRNNEPYMEPFAEMDLPGLLTRLGFKDIRIEPFAEQEGTLAADYSPWRYPWTVISAERA